MRAQYAQKGAAMKLRIVLSVCVLFLLCIAIGFHLGARADTGLPTDNGIGTSPSADDEPAAVQSYPEPLLACGIWIDATPELADARSLAGEPPDIVVAPTLHASCWDAVMICANLYPTRGFVRGLVYQGWRAREAPTPHALLELRRLRLRPLHAGFPILAILELLTPLVTAIVAKVFATKVKNVSRRAEIAGYADTAFHVVEGLGKQQGWTGLDKYNRFIQEIVNSLKAAGQPDLTGQEMAQLQGLATTKALMAKVHAVLPPARPLPLPPPPRG